MRAGWGWAGTAGEFLGLPRDSWSKSLHQHHQHLWGSPPSGSQVAAWAAEFDAVVGALRECLHALPEAAPAWGVVFEYELPMEGGRRPDVVVLAGRTLVVVECKSVAVPSQADIDQVWAYARDLSEYHEASHDLTVVPVLVMGGAAPGFAAAVDGVAVTAPEQLGHYLFDAYEPGAIDLDGWLHAPYHPLPSLVAAARRIFEHEPLPHVKRALAAGVPETVELLGSIVDGDAAEGTRSLAFVTGVPGAGKTLVGLRLVYERSAAAGRATFLSGNGPLVAVLQDALRSRVFVRDLHAFIRTHGINQRASKPGEHVVVFDEAQRAWDGEYMHTKRGVAASEPDLLVQIGERIEGWSTLVGLVGGGQEIHSGEEAGMAQWKVAASPPNAAERWHVHCPPALADTFTGLPVTTHDRLDLVVSLRSRRAEELHRWVHLLLEGSISLAARQAQRMASDTFPMYVTRSLDDAKGYARDRFAGEPDRRYGLVASSHAKILPKHGVDNSFIATSRMNIAAWFNATPDDPKSCCALDRPVTEFGCQGLELDLPIVCWGEDVRWDGSMWQLTPVRRRYRQDDPQQLLRNTYRVLLTRGRDGFVVFLPPVAHLDATEHALLAAGVRPLPEAGDLTAAV